MYVYGACLFFMSAVVTVSRSVGMFAKWPLLKKCFLCLRVLEYNIYLCKRCN